ncbi:MAG: Lrp/AsnC family transcriptional regulator [Magnetococcales bacterium]|nr:Lrp/AsnC family transcriptional regulator [Magnetococcales bacterium]
MSRLPATPVVAAGTPALLSPLEQAILHTMQDGFPLQATPFALLADQLQTNAARLIACLEQMLQKKMISRFGPLYNVERMGGAVTLAAMSIPEARFAEVAAQVNALPEVAHNYQRQHTLNMWFVLATESIAAQIHILDLIAARTALPVFNFPKEREFHIGFRVALGSEGIHTAREKPPQRGQDGGRYAPYVSASADRAIVLATQAGLPLHPQPYHVVAERIGLPPREVMERMHVMRTAGVIRRLGIIPNHYGLGLRMNGMTVWDVPEERMAFLGARVGDLECVTHCYQRPRRLPEWPYNLFAMVHGRTRAEVDEKRLRIAAILGQESRASDVLFSTRILKKNGLRLPDSAPAPSPESLPC